MNLKDGMWKTFVKVSDNEQWIVPMCVTGAWEPSGNWTDILLWTVKYEEKKRNRWTYMIRNT